MKESVKNHQLVKWIEENAKSFGRPTKFRPEYPQLMLDFFSRERYETTKEVFYYKNGDEKEKEIRVASDLPFLEEFARSIGVNDDTLLEWAKEINKDKYQGFIRITDKKDSSDLTEREQAANAVDEKNIRHMIYGEYESLFIKDIDDLIDRRIMVFVSYSVVYKKCKQIQKEFIVSNALSGRTNPIFSIFTAKNFTDMRDVKEIKQDHVHTHTLKASPELLELKERYEKELSESYKAKAIDAHVVD